MAGEGGWDEAGAAGFGERRLKNTLPLYGNKSSMNLNSMILTNVLGSPYFKEELVAYKTFHEVVDEIYYKVEHLEPWEKNSRKLAGQVGMCAGVRGVAAGGIVSTAYCLLFKLFTLKLTRKQVSAMLNHKDSPYIRGIGFMYIRYSQPPADFWDWFSPFLEDEEDIDLKAGGGYSVTIGEVCRMMLSKLDWFGTLFPRLPVHVQKSLEAKLQEFQSSRIGADTTTRECNGQYDRKVDDDGGGGGGGGEDWGEAARRASMRNSPARNRSRERYPEKKRSLSHSRERRYSPSHSRNRARFGDKPRSRSRDMRQSPSREKRRSYSTERTWSRDRCLQSRSKDQPCSKVRRRSRSRDRQRSRSRERQRSRSRERQISRSRERQRSRSRERQGSRSRNKRRSPSHSRDRHQRGSDFQQSRLRDCQPTRSRSRERKRSRSPPDKHGRRK